MLSVQKFLTRNQTKEKNIAAFNSVNANSQAVTQIKLMRLYGA